MTSWLLALGLRAITLRLLALALVAGASNRPVQAQAPIQWQLFGMPYLDGSVYNTQLFDVAILSQAGVSADTVYIAASGLWKTNQNDMSGVMEDMDSGSTRVIEITTEGYILAGARAGSIADGMRSTDGGRSWFYDNITIPIRVNGLPVERGCGVVALFQSTLPALGGAVYAGCGPEVWRSYQGGAFHSWAVVGEPGGELGVMSEMPPSAMLPEGRLVAGTQGRIATSDDGGATWRARFTGPTIVEDLALAADLSHPYGGTLYAGGLEFGRGPDPLASVYASNDGAATWRRVHAFVDGEFVAHPNNGVALAVGPDGALYGGLRQVVGGPAPDVGTVIRSRDGGVTWESVAAGFGGWAVNAFAVGRDGRLYLVADRGLWRTAEPITVASEAEPDAASGVGVSVRPNPARGRVEVVLSLAEAGAVRVVVIDALGREIAVVLDGAAGAGETVAPVETGAWPAGVYVVRVAAGAQTATARLVVAR